MAEYFKLGDTLSVFDIEVASNIAVVSFRNVKKFKPKQRIWMLSFFCSNYILVEFEKLEHNGNNHLTVIARQPNVRVQRKVFVNKPTDFFILSNEQTVFKSTQNNNSITSTDEYERLFS